MPKEQQVILASDFENRSDLESYIKAEVGQDSNSNKEAENVIQGTREQLKKLHLNDKRTCYGFKVVITDFPTKDLLEKK